MELHLQNQQMAEGVEATLVNGPFIEDHTFTVITPGNGRQSGRVAKVENDATVVVEVGTDCWFLRRVKGSAPVPMVRTTLPVEHWVVGGRT